eukprot:gene25562-22624_t
MVHTPQQVSTAAQGQLIPTPVELHAALQPQLVGRPRGGELRGACVLLLSGKRH